MKFLLPLLAASSAVLLNSCADTYYAGEMPRPHHGGPHRVIESDPVRVERHRYVEESPVVVERYSESPQQSRPYYGDPVPGTTYRRTTTRTYQGY